MVNTRNVEKDGPPTKRTVGGVGCGKKQSWLGCFKRTATLSVFKRPNREACQRPSKWQESSFPNLHLTKELQHAEGSSTRPGKLMAVTEKKSPTITRGLVVLAVPGPRTFWTQNTVRKSTSSARVEAQVELPVSFKKGVVYQLTDEEWALKVLKTNFLHILKWSATLMYMYLPGNDWAVPACECCYEYTIYCEQIVRKCFHRNVHTFFRVEISSEKEKIACTFTL